MVFCNTDLFADTDAEYPLPPCFSKFRGLFYPATKFGYTPVLHSNMPLDILLGYIIADSISAHSRAMLPTNEDERNFIKNLSSGGDTLNYALKYMYRLADYNPMLFYHFTQGQVSKRSLDAIEREIIARVHNDCDKSFCKKAMLLHPHYILHVRVNETQLLSYKHFDGEDYYDVPRHYLVNAYCSVLDTIKGQVLPDISTCFVVSEKELENGTVIMPIITPVSQIIGVNTPRTNFAFDYNPQWTRANRQWTKPMFDSEGNHWVMPEREYIVLLRPRFYCGEPFTAPSAGNPSTRTYYYSLMPVAGDLSGGMFPIKDGNVIDEGNDFGWGEVIPLDVFKTNLRGAIDSIKNYGD